MIAPFLPDNWNGVLIIGDRASKGDINQGAPFRSSEGIKLGQFLSQIKVKLNDCAQVYAYPAYPREGTFDSLIGKKTDVKKGTHVEKCGTYLDIILAEGIDNARKFIREIKPKLVIGLGKGGSMVVHDEASIDDWRGTMGHFEGIPSMVSHSPSRVFKQRQLEFLLGHDIRRCQEVLDNGDWIKREENFILWPSFEKTLETLDFLYKKAKAGDHISCDIETRFSSQISYIGFAWSESDAICIPFMRPKNLGFHWTEDQEEEIVSRIKEILEHPNARVSGQNYHYDAQFLARNWGIRSHIWFDTMVGFHCIFSGDLPKNLALISSLFCEHYEYWKDESENHEPTVESEDSYMRYNCKDCCYTWEDAEVMNSPGGIIDQFGSRRAWEFQLRQWHCTLLPMLRGTRYSEEARQILLQETQPRKAALENFIRDIVPEDCKPVVKTKTEFFNSTSQLCTLFYKILGQPVITAKRAPGVYTPSTDDAALKQIGAREPLLRPLCEALLELRSINVYLNTFLKESKDPDSRMRTSYKLAGTVTYRLASAANVFGTGLNLQNLPKGDG